MAQSTNSRGYAITVNNWDGDDIKAFEMLSRVKFGIAVEEKGVGGTPHLQAYLYLNSPREWAVMKGKIPGRWHLENAKKSPAVNYKYCLKDLGDDKTKIKWEVGERPKGQGSRSDIHAMHEAVMGGKSADQVLLDHPTAFRYTNGLRALQEAKASKEAKEKGFNMPEVYILWGDAGTGKTRWCYENYPDLYTVPTYV